jgi:hypothetical protein
MMRKLFPKIKPGLSHSFMTLPDMLLNEIEISGIESFTNNATRETLEFVLPILLKAEKYEALQYLKDKFPEILFTFNQ